MKVDLILFMWSFLVNNSYSMSLQVLVKHSLGIVTLTLMLPLNAESGNSVFLLWPFTSKHACKDVFGFVLILNIISKRVPNILLPYRAKLCTVSINLITGCRLFFMLLLSDLSRIEAMALCLKQSIITVKMFIIKMQCTYSAHVVYQL